MPAHTDRVRRLYGAGPLHLLLMCASLALAGYAVLRFGLDGLWDPASWWQSIAVWFVGAALAHDLVLFPAYASADRLLRAASGAARPSAARRLLNHVRVPVLAAGLMFLVFLPGIVRQGSSAHEAATGLTQEPYLERWLLLSAGCLLVSALVAIAGSVRRR